MKREKERGKRQDSRLDFLTQQHEIYQQAIDILTSQGKFYINLGLKRVQKILELMGNPQKNLKFIHVAGTNGKGSVCAVLSSILIQAVKSSFSEQEAGNSEKNKNRLPFTVYHSLNKPTLRIGLFTSPHIFEYTERIKINDIEIDKEIFAQKVIKITELAQKNDIHLTEFEILTAAAFEYFAENNVDIVILETGLGGRLDATNVIEENLCSIITHIDFDHMERLGDTIEEISHEKAGIIKKNCSIIISGKNLGFKTIQQISAKKNSELYIAEKTPNFFDNCLALKGTYQSENLALVLKTIEVLNKKGFNISHKAIETGLKNVKHSCRFEYLKEQNILIDGAHNPNGAKTLRESLNYYFPNQKFKFIFGCLSSKKYPEMMKNLFTPQDEIYFYEFNNKNTCLYEELAEICEFNSKPFDEFKKDKNTLTVICGSFYMIKELLSKMGIK